MWIDDITKWPDVEFGDIYNYSKGLYTKESLIKGRTSFLRHTITTLVAMSELFIILSLMSTASMQF